MKTGSLHRNDVCLVPNSKAADSWWSRLRGLLFRRPLAADASEALLLSPCSSIHTVGMGYNLDVVFLDQAGEVLALKENVKPWRACGHRGARSTLELHAGGIQTLRIAVGDVIEWR